MNRYFGNVFCLLIVILLIFGFNAITVKAQDPGLPDSVILAGDTVVAYNPGGWSVYNVSLYCVTDDSILYANMPFKWSGNAAEIYPSRVVWHNTFAYWDIYYYPPDSGNNHFDIVALGDSEVPLLTNNQRQLEATIRFFISPDALPQLVEIYTVTDSINGIMEFANIDITFRPKFRKLRFRYGEPGQSVSEINASPTKLALKACYPNPFNSSTMIEFELPYAADCRLNIYDILGREIACLIDGELGPGRHSVIWNGLIIDGEEAISGMYFVKITVDGIMETQKIALIR
jgi:hypothetical protein